MDAITVSTAMILKGATLTSDKDGVPELTITLKATGTEVLKRVDMSDIATLIGKQVGVSIRDPQLRLATGG